MLLLLHDLFDGTGALDDGLGGGCLPILVMALICCCYFGAVDVVVIVRAPAD